MKTKKIRGHKRRWKNIERWILYNKDFNLEYLYSRNEDWVKIRIHPWSGLTATNSQIPELKGETKNRVINGLIDIYDEWKMQLDKTNEPYSLRIVLHNPNLRFSKIYCSVRTGLDWHEYLYFKPQISKLFPLKNYGKLAERLKEFNWEYRVDENHFTDKKLEKEEDIETKKWMQKMINKHSRVYISDDNTINYFTQCGDVWIGKK